MNVIDHPEPEQLNNYLSNSASAEFSDLRLHLAQCSHCRAVTEALTGLQNISQQALSEPAEEDELTDHDHQKIADYIEGQLSETEHQQQKEFIQSKPAALKAALHYASHRSAMDKAISPAERDSAAASSFHAGSRHLWSGLGIKLKQLVTFQAPVWLSVPVTAALVAVLTVKLLDISIPEQAGYKMASYQDNAIIQFRPKDHLPGIGFFAKSAQISEVYDNLKVSVSEDARFTLQWPAVSGAIKYTLRLQMFHQGNKKLLGEVTTEKTSGVISTDLDDIYHRYEWVLSGETGDNRVFLANGGFVIERLEQGVLR